MGLPIARLPGDEGVLWEVAEEHLAEAEFLFEQWERAYSSLALTLKTIARAVETRLLAHVDGLVLGGKPVRERLLVPAMTAPDPENAGVTAVAAMALLATESLDTLVPALAHDDPRVRNAAARACAFAGGDRVAPWVMGRLGARPSPHECEALFEICGALGIRVSPLVQWLQGDAPSLVAAAAKAARHSDPTVHRPVIEYLLDHPDERVRDPALVAALAWGSPRAWSQCGDWALDTTRVHRFPMALYAALGGPLEHDRLAKLLERPSHARGALSALAFAGNVRLLPLLATELENEEPRIRKLAAQAVASITGLALADAELARASAPKKEPGTLPPPEEDPAALQALPSLDDDDLDADLAPPYEDALSEPDPAAVRRSCDEARAQMAPERRWIAGRPFSLEALVGYLQEAPLGQRHVLAAALLVRTRAQIWVDTRALSKPQGRQLARAAEIARTARASSGSW